MITRRLFAGMLPGAAASAPSILKSATQTLTGAATTNIPSFYGEKDVGAKANPKMSYTDAVGIAQKRLVGYVQGDCPGGAKS